MSEKEKSESKGPVYTSYIFSPCVGPTVKGQTVRLVFIQMGRQTESLAPRERIHHPPGMFTFDNGTKIFDPVLVHERAISTVHTLSPASLLQLQCTQKGLLLQPQHQAALGPLPLL